MKLINFFDMPELNQLRDKMGAAKEAKFEVNLGLMPLDEENLRKLGREGIDVDCSEIKSLEDKTLSYRGQRILVYIRDASHYHLRAEMPRFHIAHCSTLENMTKNNRWQRYVATTRDDGYFQVNINNTGYKSLQLKICKNCLEIINWNGYSKSLSHAAREKLVSTFSITEFFEKYPKSFLAIQPQFTADTAPANKYTTDWPSISDNIKEKRRFKCEERDCGINLLDKYKEYLDVHHINGLKYDNVENNLKVLCVKCHANQPNHSHMKKSPRYKEFIRMIHKMGVKN